MEYLEVTGDNAQTLFFPTEIVELSRNGKEVKILYRWSPQYTIHVFESDQTAMKVYQALRDKKIGEENREILDKQLVNFTDLSPRAQSACKRAGVKTVGDLVKFSPVEILRIRNAGLGTKRELIEFLHNHGLKSDYE